MAVSGCLVGGHEGGPNTIVGALPLVCQREDLIGTGEQVACAALANFIEQTQQVGGEGNGL